MGVIRSFWILFRIALILAICYGVSCEIHRESSASHSTPSSIFLSKLSLYLTKFPERLSFAFEGLYGQILRSWVPSMCTWLITIHAILFLLVTVLLLLGYARYGGSHTLCLFLFFLSISFLVYRMTPNESDHFLNKPSMNEIHSSTVTNDSSHVTTQNSSDIHPIGETKSRTHTGYVSVTMSWFGNLFSTTKKGIVVNDDTKPILISQDESQTHHHENKTIHTMIIHTWGKHITRSYSLAILHLCTCVFVALSVSSLCIHLHSTWIGFPLIITFIAFCILQCASIQQIGTIVMLMIIALVIHHYANRTRIDWIQRACTHPETTWPLVTAHAEC